MLDPNPFKLQGRRVKWAGRVCRIDEYLGDNRFRVLAPDDLRYTVHRDRLVFLK